MSESKPATLRLLGAGLLGLVGASPVQGGSFEAVPILETGALHETNPRLTNDDEDDATGLIIDGRLNMQWATERTIFDLRPRGRFSIYDDSSDKDLEDDDYYLDAELNHQTVLSEYGFAAGYSDVGVRTSELESAGNDPGTGSGDVRFVDDSRRTWYVSPSWSRQLGALNLLGASFDYSDVNFDRRTTGRFPYDYTSGRLTYQRTLTPQLAGGLLLDASRFESRARTTNIENTSDTYGLSGFVNYAFSETVSGSLYAGVRDTQSEVTRQPIGIFPDGTPACLDFNFLLVPCSQKSSGLNFVGEATLSKQAERTRYDLTLSRSVSPNADGAESLRDTIDVVASRDLSPRLNGSLGVLYYTQEDAADVTARKRDYVSARVTLRWRLTQYWSLRGAYRYVDDQDKTSFTGASLNDNATNHYFFVGIRYQGRGWRR